MTETSKQNLCYVHPLSGHEEVSVRDFCDGELRIYLHRDTPYKFYWTILSDDVEMNGACSCEGHLFVAKSLMTADKFQRKLQDLVDKSGIKDEYLKLVMQCRDQFKEPIH